MLKTKGNSAMSEPKVRTLGDVNPLELVLELIVGTLCWD